MIDLIDQKVMEYAELGIEVPDFVTVSPDVFIKAFNEAQRHIVSSPGVYQSMNGISIFRLWTSVGLMEIKRDVFLPTNTIIVGDNLLLTIFTKLGVIK